MFFRFDTAVPLRWADVDSAGVVNNAVFLSLMEQARYLYFQHLGLLTDHVVPFVLAETTVKFERPGRLGMNLEVAARTRQIGGTSFQMDYEVRAGDEVLVTARAALVFVDGDLRPCPVPPAWRTAIEQFEEMQSGG
ncbi:MAG: acyl-CoA thioesterase [Planctomycetes bacterium]|nr:acyl-CoA thioesterase [Planctomycetota bacterium]